LTQASAAETQRARDAFQAGKSAFDAARYADALREFTRADQAVASPNTELMIARCLQQLGRLAEAYNAYVSVMRAAQAPPAGRYEQAARAAAQERAALVPRIALLTLRIEDPAASATLHIAGQHVPRAAWAEPYALEPGAVEVVLQDGAGRQSSQRLTLERGGSAKVELALEAAAAPSSQLLATNPAPPPSAAARFHATGADARDASSSLRTWSYVTGATGAAALAGFAVFGALSAADFAKLEDDCPARMACAASLRATAERGRSYQTLANVSLGLGIAALSAGVVLWVLGAPGDDVEVAVGGSGVRVRGAL
jgi:hypothetical protein